MSDSGSTSAAVPVQQVSKDDPDVWFVLPPGFSEIAVDESSEKRMMRMADAFDAMFPDTTPEQKLSMVVSGEYGIQAMLTAGAVHLSHCLYRRDDDGVTQGLLSVFVRRHGFPRDGREAAERIARQWVTDEPGAEVGIVVLPYGPAAVCTNERQVPIPGVFFGVEEDTVTTVRQIQTAVPLTTRSGVAIFAFTTEDIDQWDQHVKVFTEVLRSLSAAEPQVDSIPA